MKNAALDCPMGENDAGAKTVGDYLKKLALRVWTEDDEFSGKRPFGNSGWRYEVYEALARGGVVRGTFDSDGYLDTFDTHRADVLIASVLRDAVLRPAQRGEENPVALLRQFVSAPGVFINDDGDLAVVVPSSLWNKAADAVGYDEMGG